MSDPPFAKGQSSLPSWPLCSVSTSSTTPLPGGACRKRDVSIDLKVQRFTFFAPVPRLWTEAFRGENTKAEVEERIGLNPANVQNALDVLGGCQPVQSKGGEGTTCTGLLPSV